jgi:CHAD domain-containing protein
MPYLQKRRLTSCLQRIKNVADALGDVRDQDVAVLALEKLSQKAPPLAVSGINEFVARCCQKREEARAALLQLLDPNALTELQSSFADSLEAAIAPQRRTNSKLEVRNAAVVTYRGVARTTILGLLEDLEELSDSLYHPLDAKPLHRMRLAAKRLRYAIELFAHCWGHQLAMFAKKVESLQSSLGELHDCDVWIDSFGDDLARAKKHQGTSGEGSVESDAVAASVWLLSHFVKLRTKHFRNSLSRWRKWEANDLGSQLRKTLGAELPKPSTRSNAKARDEVAGAALVSASKA